MVGQPWFLVGGRPCSYSPYSPCSTGSCSPDFDQGYTSHSKCLHCFLFVFVVRRRLCPARRSTDRTTTTQDWFCTLRSFSCRNQCHSLWSVFYVHSERAPVPSAPRNRPDIVLDAELSRQTRPVATDGYGWAVSTHHIECGLTTKSIDSQESPILLTLLCALSSSPCSVLGGGYSPNQC